MPSASRTVETVEARVAENLDLGADHSLLRLEAPAIAREARPGRFVTISFAGRTDPLLPRPFAVFGADAGKGTVEIFFKVIGRGTRIMVGLVPGDRVRLVGPLGTGWRAPAEGRAVLVAGGTGWGALRFLACELARAGGEVSAVWGMCGSELFPLTQPVAAPGVEVVCATEDGTRGFCGTSVDCLRALIEGEIAKERATLYGAGPVPMLAALALLAREEGIPCQVSLEARMACGIGVCRGCVVNAREPAAETGLRRRTVCADGPVFDAAELDWEDLC